MSYLERMVLQFMVKHDQYISACKNDRCPPSVELLRARLMLEEAFEYLEAIQENKPLEEIADALGDLLYVVVGSFIAHGIDMMPVFNEIQRSNMTKAVLNEHGKGGKVVGKEGGFEPPRLRELMNGEDL